MDENTAPNRGSFTQHELRARGTATAPLLKPNSYSKDPRSSAVMNVFSSAHAGPNSPSIFRQPLASISSNLPHQHFGGQQALQASGKPSQDIPAGAYGPLASAILTRKQHQQSPIQRSGHQRSGLRLSGTSTLSCSSSQHATACQSGHSTRTASGQFAQTPMQEAARGAAAMATADPTSTANPEGNSAMLQETATTMHAVPELTFKRFQTPSTAVLLSSTPGSSEALQRLQQQQQLRWQQQQASRMAQHGKVPAALPPPFSRHPAVSTLSGPPTAECRDTLPCVAANLTTSMPAASHQSPTRLSGQLQDWMAASHAGCQAEICSLQDSHSTTTAVGVPIPTMCTQQTGISTACGTDSMVPSMALLQAAAVSADLQAILQKLQRTQRQDGSTTVKSLERVLLSSFVSNNGLHSVTSGNPHPSMAFNAQPAASLAARLVEYEAPAHAVWQGMHAKVASGQLCSAGDFAGCAEQQQSSLQQGAVPASSIGFDSKAAPAVIRAVRMSEGNLPQNQDMAGHANTLALVDDYASDGSACLAAAHMLPADSTAGYDESSGVRHSSQLQDPTAWQVQHVPARSWPSEGMFIKPHRSQKTQLHRASLFSPAESTGADDNKTLLAPSGHALQALNQPQAAGAVSSSASKLLQALQQQQTGSTGTLINSAGHSSAGAPGHIQGPTPTGTAGSTASSGSTCHSSLQCAPGSVAVSNAVPPADYTDGLPLMGTLTASLPTCRPRSITQSALARPTLPKAPAAAASTGGSILDTIQLKWEGGSSAAANHRIDGSNPAYAAAAPQASGQHGGAPGRALEQLADRAATLLQQHQQPQRHVSRLQSASYPAAPIPSMHAPAAIPPLLTEGPEESAAYCMDEHSIRAAPSAHQAMASSMPAGFCSQQEAAAAAASKSSTAKPTQQYCSYRYMDTMSVDAASILPEHALQDLRPLCDSRHVSQNGTPPQHSSCSRLSDVTDTLHAAAQLRASATASGSHAGSNSTGITGYAASHVAVTAAGSSARALGGSRLSLWQSKPTAGMPSVRQHSVRSELRASLTGALRSMTGVLRSSVSQHISLQPPQQLQPARADSVSPPAPFISPLEPANSLSSAAAEVYLTPEAADSESDASRSCSSSSSVQDSLADTAQSAPTYALRPHMMGLSRSTPFVGLPDDSDDDYVLTALHHYHGRSAHAATYWVANMREYRAAKYGSGACRKLTWGEARVGAAQRTPQKTRDHHQQQQQQQQQHGNRHGSPRPRSSGWVC